MREELMDTPRQRGTPQRRWFVALVLALAGGLLLAGLLLPADAQPLLQGAATDSRWWLLALPAYLAGVFSLLSPCSLPILPAYFAFTFGSRQRVVAMSLAFFCGLATTMVVLGASFTLLGALIYPYRTTITRIGGVLIIGLGLLSIAGKGFSGVQFQERPAATLLGTYVYGLTFAFGWSACVGPILGAILTTLASAGLSVLAGAGLALMYALGIATPLTLIALFFSRLGQGSAGWRWLRGRAWTLRIGQRKVLIHSTSLISGILLIGVGVLLASGQLSQFTNVMGAGQAAEWTFSSEEWLRRTFLR